MATWLPKVRVAACNVAPVFLDAGATVQKTIGLIREAAGHGADLVVFPESYIPAFPLWAAVAAPIDNHALFARLAQQSLHIDGPELRALRAACATHRVSAHIGFSERSRASVGCVWNSSALISRDGSSSSDSRSGEGGALLNHARKLAPTFYEKLVWAPGDAAGLRVVDVPGCGRVGSLICGENTNPLARWALMAQGEQIHVSSWPAVWPTRRADDGPGGETGGKQYDNVAANRMRAAAHCFEAKCFGVMCSGVMDRAMRDAMVKHAPSCAATLDGLQQGASMFLDPTGAQIGEQIQGEEGIIYADLDLNACVEPKQFHDVVGGYQRFDVFDLKIDRRRLEAENAFRDEDGRDSVGNGQFPSDEEGATR